MSTDTAKPSPTMISLTDRLRLQLAQERALRTKVQLDLAQLAHNEAINILVGVEAGITTEYNLTEKDKIDAETGAIIAGSPVKGQ